MVYWERIIGEELVSVEFGKILVAEKLLDLYFYSVLRGWLVWRP